jgi:hypothetical protein
MKRITYVCASVAGAAALLALPASGLARDNHGQGHSNTPKRCSHPNERVGFTVRGTLVSYTADNPATPANEGTVTVTVTGANRHARNSGEIADQNATQPGVQVAGATYTVPTTDAFRVRLVDFQGTDTPSPGDAVTIVGSIVRTKAKCAPAGTSLADRYGAVNVRRVVIADRDPDA